jgi:UDP-N-acetyl-D-glucosamine dehydrogenase
MSTSPLAAAPATSLQEKIESRTAQVAVVGLGYVGLPLSLLFSEAGFPVLGFDIDRRKVEMLTRGGSYINRIPPTEIQAARERGFESTSEYSRIKEADVIILCVPTPLTEHCDPDLRFITDTAESVAQHLRSDQLIILESTTYPGTTEEVLVPILDRNPSGLWAKRAGLQDGPGFYVAFSPEREDPGNDSVARRDIPKVIGGFDAKAAELASALYRAIFRRVVQVSTPAAAEMTKLLENTYRCVNIALVNELKLLCLRMGLDIWEIIEAAKTKPFGFHPFYPGPGLGGHCIPVDPFYLSWKAKQFDFHTRFIELAGEVNAGMPYHVVASVANALNRRKKALNGSKVMILGIAYKKDIDDLRESPALTIIELLRKEGAEVFYNDPYFPFVGRGRHYDLNMSCTPLEDLAAYDCVLIATDHSDYDYAKIVAESQLVVDTRHATAGIAAANLVLC